MAKNYNVRKADYSILEAAREASDARAEAFIVDFYDRERKAKALEHFRRSLKQKEA